MRKELQQSINNDCMNMNFCNDIESKNKIFHCCKMVYGDLLRDIKYYGYYCKIYWVYTFDSYKHITIDYDFVKNNSVNVIMELLATILEDYA